MSIRPKMKKTVLHQCHVELGARMVDFAGWDMPIQYEGVMPEHKWVRNHAGLFDVSHMGEFEITGPNSLASLQKIVTNDVSTLEVGQAQYTVMCLPNGGCVDDLLIYRLATERFLCVVNASNIEKDFKWMQENLLPDTQLINLSDDYALLALQGPKAEAALEPLCEGISLRELAYYHCAETTVGGVTCLLARTGYTGEDGFEIYLPAKYAQTFWNKLLQHDDVKPIGLAARDTLRLEMGYCLYGHELSESITPIEAMLKWVVKLDKPDFIGKVALGDTSRHPRRLIAVAVQGRGIPRQGYAIYHGGQQVGEVTSGTFSPQLEQGIALALVDKAFTKEALQLDVRGKRLPLERTKLPFVASHVKK